MKNDVQSFEFQDLVVEGAEEFTVSFRQVLDIGQILIFT